LKTVQFFLVEGCDVFGLHPLKQRSMPKGCFATIPKSDGGGSIEKLHAFLDARFPGSNPNIPRLLSFKPWPT
jgi:hypothetical protein